MRRAWVFLVMAFGLGLSVQAMAETKYGGLSAGAASVPPSVEMASVSEGQKVASWRTATTAELHGLIPARAPVVAERIETEFRTASGVTDGKGRFIAGVVLITAGYSAEGKYSNFLIAQVPLHVGALALPAGHYVFGWTRSGESLTVKFYEAATGRQLGEVEAKQDLTLKRVESFRVWPPGERSVVQLGRFVFPYVLETAP